MLGSPDVIIPSKHLVVIGGPTASGKTALAIEVAQALQTEIVSADSRQFYRELAIGAAHPSTAELAAVPHHLVGHRSVTEPLSAADFEVQALQKIAAIHQTSDCAVVVGGSGLYLQALLYGFDDMPTAAPEIRAQLQNELASKGLAAISAELLAADPDLQGHIDVHNPRRVVRALEVVRATGRPFSHFKQGQTKARPFVVHAFCLDMERSVLYERINRRVMAMLEAGLEAEARALLPHRNLQALQTVGYKELFVFFDGLWELPTAVAEIQKNTRRYAKRQITWFKSKPEFRWVADAQALLKQLPL